MKLSILSFVLVLAMSTTYAQTNSGVSASFSIDKTEVTPSKGFAMSSITSAERKAMPKTIAEGILVYDTDSKSLWYFNGGNWVEIVNPYNNQVLSLGTNNKHLQPTLGMIKYNEELDTFQGYTKKGWVNLH